MIDIRKIIERLDEAIARKRANADVLDPRPMAPHTRSAYVRIFRLQASNAIDALATALVELDAIEGEKADG